MKYYPFLFIIISCFQQAFANEYDNVSTDSNTNIQKYNKKKIYPMYVTIIGIFVISLYSFLGTYLPMQFKKKSYFKENTMLFRCIKLFGTGIILSIAFIHMVIPADQALASDFSYQYFNKHCPSFVGILVILGMVITHLFQVLTSHLLYRRVRNGYPTYEESSYETSDLSVSTKCTEIDHTEIDHTEIEKDITHEKIIFREHDGQDGNESNDRKNIVKFMVATDGGVNNQFIMEWKERQIVSYLLEIGISFHSILIGVSFGLRNGEEIIIIMVALLFHQIFEGISLSSVFIEAHFKRYLPILFMIIIYTCAFPLGSFIGIFVRNMVESTDSLFLTVRSIIDALAGGVLIYDDVVNILSRHCSSSLFKQSSLKSKCIQLMSFYLGIITMGVVGFWVF